MTPQQRDQVALAIEHLERAEELHPVRLHGGMVVTVPSQGGVELWGALTSRVRAGAQVVPRTAEWLPKGLEVEGAELIDSEEGTQRVRLQVKNSTPRSVELHSNLVLAELHNVFPPGGPRPVIEKFYTSIR